MPDSPLASKVRRISWTYGEDASLWEVARTADGAWWWTEWLLDEDDYATGETEEDCTDELESQLAERWPYSDRVEVEGLTDLEALELLAPILPTILERTFLKINNSYLEWGGHELYFELPNTSGRITWDGKSNLDWEQLNSSG